MRPQYSSALRCSTVFYCKSGILFGRKILGHVTLYGHKTYFFVWACSSWVLSKQSVPFDIWISSGWTAPLSVGPVHQINRLVQDLWKFWDRSEIFIFIADELISYSFVVNHSLNRMNNDRVIVRKEKKDSRRLCYCVLKGFTFII